MNKTSLLLLVGAWQLLAFGRGFSQGLVLVADGKAKCTIVIPAHAVAAEQKGATVLQHYIRAISGARVAIATESATVSGTVIYVGHTERAMHLPDSLTGDGYLLHCDGRRIVITGGGNQGTLYGCYRFVEACLGCRKPDGGPATIPRARNIMVPANLHDVQQPGFIYREAYYPAALDSEYRDWHHLQRFEELWGLWGHSFYKLVPPAVYFDAHPEYFALVKGRRQSSQLCLADEHVLEIVVNDLKRRMAEQPGALYWSVSPNDNTGYCTCSRCKAIDASEGGPQGSLLNFVNKVAAVFPDKKFTTLAYGYTSHPTRSISPATNVYVMLSSIDADRGGTLEKSASAAAFRNNLQGWLARTPRVFVWDYTVQFTNFLAPFPNLNSLGPNISYLKKCGVQGIFEQGSGDTYSEWAELKSYVLAKMLWNPGADANKLVSAFVTDYYGSAARYLQQYIDLLAAGLTTTQRLDIYGNPVNEWNTYLSPELNRQYAVLFNKAAAAVKGNTLLEARVQRARLPLEYTVLQQARFYGIEPSGIFERNEDGDWVVRPGLPARVSQFVADCNKAGVMALSEGGPWPDKYQLEWSDIFRSGVKPNKAIGAQVKLKYPFVADYPAKGMRTLADGVPGYNDYSYNWLCFYGVPMVATVDLGEMTDLSEVSMSFLDDPRHWIFAPQRVTVEISEDGRQYASIGSASFAVGDEHYEVTHKTCTISAGPKTARYIRVRAETLTALPVWRLTENKKPMMACDEIYVQ